MASMSSSTFTSHSKTSASAHKYRRSSVLSHKAPRKRTFIASMTKFLSNRDVSLIPPSNDNRVCCPLTPPKRNVTTKAIGAGNGNGPIDTNTRWGRGDDDSFNEHASATVLGALVIALSFSLAVETVSRLSSDEGRCKASHFISQFPQM